MSAIVNSKNLSHISIDRKTYIYIQIPYRDDHDHLAELAAVFGGRHKSRKRMVVKSAKEADQMVPGSTAVFLEVLDDLE